MEINSFKSSKISYTIGNKIKFIECDKIIYVQASGAYCELFLIGGRTIVMRNSLTNLLNKLDNKFFTRIHRSTIANVNHIEELINSSYQEMDAKMSDNKLLRISKSNRHSVLRLLGVLP